jgi:hypothetical protein
MLSESRVTSAVITIKICVLWSIPAPFQLIQFHSSTTPASPAPFQLQLGTVPASPAPFQLQLGSIPASLQLHCLLLQCAMTSATLKNVSKIRMQPHQCPDETHKSSAVRITAQRPPQPQTDPTHGPEFTKLIPQIQALRTEVGDVPYTSRCSQETW